MRYFDELPLEARANLRTAIGAWRDGEPAMTLAVRRLGVPEDMTLRTTGEIFDRMIGEIAFGSSDSLVEVVFGKEQANRVFLLCEEIHEEQEVLVANRVRRICERIADGRHTSLDVSWLVAQAQTLQYQQILEMRPFDGDESEAKELSRAVVSGRKPHTCHWTKRTIAPGERHLVIKEVVNGEFLTTRHSLLAVYLDVVGEDPGLAAHLAPRPINEVAA